MSQNSAEAASPIIPMSFRRAFDHIDGCLKRRSYIAGATYVETEEGIEVTVRRLSNHQYIENCYVLSGRKLDDPVILPDLAPHAMAVGVGRARENHAHNARMLLRQTALYVGLDGLFHITGEPDAIEAPVQTAAITPIRRIA